MRGGGSRWKCKGYTGRKTKAENKSMARGRSVRSSQRKPAKGNYSNQLYRSGSIVGVFRLVSYRFRPGAIVKRPLVRLQSLKYFYTPKV